MRILEPAFLSSLQSTRDGGIAPAGFAWIEARNRDTGAVEAMGLWTGDEDITVNVRTPSGGLTSRAYIGGVNLSISGTQYAGDLTDNATTVSMSQIADAAQHLVRATDVRRATCQIHSTTWTGGALTSNPDLDWIGIVDDVLIGTPEVGGEGNIGLSIRSEIMADLTAINPAKSSNSHQQRRSGGDRFCEYAGTIKARVVQGYKE